MANFKPSLLFVFWFVTIGSFAQTYHFQNGLSASGGISYQSHFDKNYKPVSNPNLTEKVGFSWELSYLNTKLLGENVAFTYGIGVMSLRNEFSTKTLNYKRKDGTYEQFYFSKTSQVVDVYHVGLNFRWSFFLNQGRNRFFLGPGITLSAPVFFVANVKGATAQTDTISFTDRYLTEKGPYFFVPLEAIAGYQFEFDDCSLFRAEAFFQFRAQGLIQKSDDKILGHYFGLRISYFFNND